MEEVLSIDGIDFQIFKHLKFNDLMNLRLCNTNMKGNVSFFSETIFSTLKKRYLSSFNENDEHLPDEGISFYDMFNYYYEMEFIKFFINDKSIFPDFIKKLKSIKVDNYQTKLYVSAKNYHQLMYHFKHEDIRKKIIKKERTDDNLVWVKNEYGGWRESTRPVYSEVEVEIQLMDRRIIEFSKFNIF